MLKMGKTKLKNNETFADTKKKPFMDRFMSKGMDFWFYDKNTIKVFRLGIILVTIGIWVFIPLFIVKLIWNFWIYNSYLSLIFAILITYSFFGILHGLKNVNNVLKSFK